VLGTVCRKDSWSPLKKLGKSVGQEKHYGKWEREFTEARKNSDSDCESGGFTRVTSFEGFLMKDDALVTEELV